MRNGFWLIFALIATTIIWGPMACNKKTDVTEDSDKSGADGDSDSDGDADNKCDAHASCFGDDDADGCWQCAKESTCKKEHDACQADEQCAKYAPCAETCRMENPKAVNFIDCRMDCKKEYPDGIELFEALEYCLACDACTDACDALSISVCEVYEPDSESESEKEDTEEDIDWAEMVDIYSQAPDDPPEGWLYTEGNTVKLSNGDGDLTNDDPVHLHGVSVIDVSNVFNNNFEAQVDEAQSWGANIIRLPVYPEDEPQDDQPSDGGWTKDNAQNHFEKYLSPIVEYVTNTKGMYAIIDWHYIQNVIPDSDLDTLTKAFWADMAPRYSDNPRVLYEVFNEPIKIDVFESPRWTFWQPIAQNYVDIIREHAPNNLVLVGGPTWSQTIGGCNNTPILSHNIMYVGHIYSFHIEQADGNSPILDQFADCGGTFPVILTEWGLGSWNGGMDPDIGDVITGAIRDNNFHFTAWAFHHKWGPPMLTDMGTYERNEYGEYVYNFLAEYKEE
ncbi:MAG: glycoside hydrolase family 5 protein [Deltaproteobacteria bacterium]|nr:glycoside hydrolase family 5 protein [Deltaproteobacteria bacterium]